MTKLTTSDSVSCYFLWVLFPSERYFCHSSLQQFIKRKLKERRQPPKKGFRLWAQGLWHRILSPFEQVVAHGNIHDFR
eukprot:scaffold24641_cov211-Cylindrotheca_fusiformis.AAC.1